MKIEIIVLLALAACVSAQIPCSANVGGYYFDLNPLANNVIYTTTDSMYLYSASFCSPVKEANCAASNGAVCQYSNASPYNYVHTLASYSTLPSWSLITPSVPQNGVQWVFNDGDSCYFNGQPIPRQLTIQFVCSAQSPSISIATDPSNPCAYIMTVLSFAGCPKQENCLSALAPLVGQHFPGSDGGFNYWLAINSTVEEPTCASKKGLFCQYSNAGAFLHVLALDEPNPATICENPHAPLVVYNSGDVCFNNGVVAPRQVFLTFPCDPQAQPGSSYTIGMGSNPCVYNVTFPTSLTC
jgi:hypothetical protein